MCIERIFKPSQCYIRENRSRDVRTFFIVLLVNEFNEPQVRILLKRY